MLDPRRNLLLSCLACFLISGSMVRAQQVGSIAGELHLSGSDFPGRVFIELQLRGATLASAYSDDQGKFAFAGLASNPYHIVINDERFLPVNQVAVVDISISAISMAQVNLSLRETVRSESLPRRDPASNPNLIDPSEYRRHFPKDAIKEFDRGVAAAKGGKRGDAIQHYQRSISLAPDFYPAHNNLGSVYLSKSEFALARTQFEEAIRLNQSDAEARLNLANVLLKTNHNEDALQSVEEGLRRTPNSAFGQFLLGSIFQQMRKTPEAESALRRCLELDPLMFDAHLALINLYIQENRTREAVNELRIFLKNFPENVFAPQAKQVLHKLENGNRN